MRQWCISLCFRFPHFRKNVGLRGKFPKFSDFAKISDDSFCVSPTFPVMHLLFTQCTYWTPLPFSQRQLHLFRRHASSPCHPKCFPTHLGHPGNTSLVRSSRNTQDEADTASRVDSFPEYHCNPGYPMQGRRSYGELDRRCFLVSRNGRGLFAVVPPPQAKAGWHWSQPWANTGRSEFQP